MSVVANNIIAGASGQGGSGHEISRSLRFNQPDSAHLSKYFATSGNRKTWTWSSWVKLGKEFSSGYHNLFANLTGNTNGLYVYFHSNGILYITDYNLSGGAGLSSAMLFRDHSAWYHIVIAFDTTQSTAADRVKLYVNGVQQTLNGAFPNQNLDGQWNQGSRNHFIGKQSDNLSSYSLEAYLAECQFVDGQALLPSSFGEFDDNNVWQAKEYSGSYGTNGFYLDFSDASSTGALGANANTTDYATTVGAVTTSRGSDFYAVGLYPPNNLFDGSATSSAIVYGGYDSSNYSDIIWTPNGAYSVSSSLRVYAGYYSTIYVNGVSKATGGPSSAEAWITLAHTGSITSITFENTSNSNAVRAAAIEIDGTILTTTAWTVNNLTAAGPTATYNSTYGSGITATEAAKVFDGDSSTYGVANSDFVGFNYSGTSVKFKIENSSSAVRYFYVQPWVSGSVSNSGTFGSQTVGTVSANYWTIPANSTGTAVFTFPSNYNGYGRLFPSNSGADQRIYYMIAGPADQAGIDSLVDTPTNYGTDSGLGGEVGGNYCVWNPLSATGATLTNGNLEATLTGSGGGRESVRGTLAVSSGKYYWEELLSDTGNQSGFYGVVAASTESNIRLDAATSGTNAVLYAAWNGNKAINGVSTSYGASFTTNDIIGVALDLDGGTITFYKNGSSQGSITLPATGIAYTPTFAWNGAGSAGTTKTNWGARAFSFAAPSGYKSLCTTNLPEPVIADSSAYMDVKTYTANASNQTISGLAFSPDLIWTKSRGAGASHSLWDTVRGVNKYLGSNLTTGEVAVSDGLNAFTSDGFTLGYNENSNYYNGNGAVAWAWDAGSSNTSVSAGSLNSSVYDQSRTWSNDVTGSAYSSGYAKTKGFDGSLSTRAGGSFTFTPPSPIACTKVRIYMTTYAAPANTIYLNGVDIASQIPITNQYYVPLEFTPSNNQFVSYQCGAAGSEPGWFAKIELLISGNWVALIDSGVSVADVPSIASTVRANPSAGFSIVKWVSNGSNQTVGHGLNATPEFIILRQYSGAENWAVYHKDMGGSNGYLQLNSTIAFSTNAAPFNSTDPTSSVFSYNNTSIGGGNGNNVLALCFTSVEGYSKMGKYTGNGSADGPFIYTGFKVAFFMVRGRQNQKSY